MAPKIINLDALIPEKQYFTLDGKDHELLTPSVDVYMKVLKANERMKSSSDEVAQMEQAIMLITLCCPTINDVRLKQLPLVALKALADAIQEQMEGVIDEASAEEGVESDAP